MLRQLSRRLPGGGVGGRQTVDEKYRRNRAAERAGRASAPGDAAHKFRRPSADKENAPRARRGSASGGPRRKSEANIDTGSARVGGSARGAGSARDAGSKRARGAGSDRAKGLSTDAEWARGGELFTRHINAAADAPAPAAGIAKPRAKAQRPLGNKVSPSAGAAAPATCGKYASAQLDARAAAIEFDPGGVASLLRCGRAAPEVLRAGIAPVACRLLEVTAPQLGSLHRLYARHAPMTAGAFFALLRCEDTAFFRVLVDQVVFKWADLDCDGSLEFDEFVLAACICCTLTDDELLRLCFDLVDVDGSGDLTYDEAVRLHGAKDAGLVRGERDVLLAAFVPRQRHIQFPEFAGLMKQQPRLWHTIKALPFSFSRAALGHDAWARARAAFRRRCPDEAATPRGELMAIHTQLFPRRAQRMRQAGQDADNFAALHSRLETGTGRLLLDDDARETP